MSKHPTVKADLPPDPRDHREPWDVLEGEPAKAYHWFSRYLALGYDRSLSRVVSQAYDEGRGEAKGMPNLAQLKKWSSRWRWTDRSIAYDNDLERKKRERDEDAVIAACEAGALRLKAFMTAASQPIEDLVASIRSAEYREWYATLDYPDRWRLAERMARLLPQLLEAQRAALGAKLDAQALAGSTVGRELEEQAAGLLEMDEVERVAAVLSVLEESGFGPRKDR